MSSALGKRKRNRNPNESTGSAASITPSTLSTSTTSALHKKQKFSSKTAARMLEESDIEDLHCEELDSGTESGSDTETDESAKLPKKIWNLCGHPKGVQ